MGEVNMLPATVREVSEVVILDAGFATLALPTAAFGEPSAPGQPCTLLIRPEHFREPGPGALPLGTGRVEDAGFFGTHVRAHLRLGAGRIVAHFPQAASLQVGDEVTLGADPARVVLLPGRPGS
jgi:spermidine/putrescine transport system ATP-binding protein